MSRLTIRPEHTGHRFSQFAALPLLGAALVAAITVAAPTSAALASAGGLTVSTDGTTYQPNNTLPVLQTMGRVVPGDTQSDRIWVRNDAPVAGQLRIDVIDPSTDDAALAEHVSLNVTSASEIRSEPTTIASAITRGSCTVLAAGLVLQPGESAELNIGAAVSPELSQQSGTLGTVAFRLRGVLEDASVGAAVSPGAPCGADTSVPYVAPTTSLSATGGPHMLGLGALGAVAIATGAAVAVASVRAGRRMRAAVETHAEATR